MLVVLAIMTIILLAINMVFSSLSAAVTLGSGQSQVLASGRAIGDYLYDDFKHMVGPGSGGFLVIYNRTVSNSTLLPTDTTTLSATIRDDQIIFIRDRAGLNPICPPCGLPWQASNGNTYSAPAATNAAYLRVFYGHGSEYDDNTTYGPGPHLVSGTGPNGYAFQWCLARQALFLNAKVGDATDLAANALPSPAGASVTAGYLYSGLTDSVPTSLPTLDNFLRSTVNPNIPPGATGDSYAANAVQLLYGLNGNGNCALLVRRLPYAYTNGQLAGGVSVQGASLNTNDFSSTSTTVLCQPPSPTPVPPQNKVAPTHAFLAGGVSDFIVDFAACTNAAHPNEPDFNTTDGSIQWYGMSANGTDNVATFPTSAQYPAPSIMRYYPQTGANSNTYFFEHGDVGMNGIKAGSPATTTAKLSAWPFLIRIRYRVHDTAGKVIGADGNPGRLFEQILYVNRN
jgi:hypothetical protein